MTPWILLLGGKKEGKLPERSEFFPSPHYDINSRRLSPSRAHLSLPASLGKTKKVVQARQGTKKGMNHQAHPPKKVNQTNTIQEQTLLLLASCPMTSRGR